MTPFQLKRLEYFAKAAQKGNYIQLGAGDVEIFEEIKKQTFKDAVKEVMTRHENTFEKLKEYEDKYDVREGSQIRILEDNAGGTNEQVGAILRIISGMDNDNCFLAQPTDSKFRFYWKFHRLDIEAGHIELVQE